MKKHTLLLLSAFVCVGLLSGCASVKSTAGMPPVKNFEVDRYLGTWYEIARMPNKNTDQMTNVTASYISGDKSSRIMIENRGCVDGKNFKSVEGWGKFQRGRNIGVLDVTYLWPIFSDYRILEIDPGYRTALVCGNNVNSLWILSRTPKLDDAMLAKMIKRAKDLGFPTEKLIYTVHTAK